MNALLKYCRPTLTALGLAMAAGLAQADERESLEALRQTTLSLIEALVQGGVITRDKADQLLADARQRAQQMAAASAASAATVPPALAPTTNSSGKPVQRVPYVSEALRVQLRNEVKEEILAQARQERWGVPNAPSWIDRIRIEGDLRYRYQADRPDSGNTAPEVYFATEANDVFRTSRAPDFAAYALSGDGVAVPSASTQDARNRERIRLRLGLTAKVSDEVGVGVRLATGSATDRVSTNQTLGQNFNKYQLFVDRAFVRVDPADWLTVQAGRIPNPWFATDMVWSENLNFEGVAATTRWMRDEGQLMPFATVGWFPLREESPGIRGSRSLVGAQVGASFELSSRTKVKMGLAWYRYQNIEGREDLAYEDVAGSALVDPVNYGRYEYPVSLRQKGNTVFETNPGSDASLPPVWGLAYRFRPLVLTASAEFSHFAPFSLLVSAEYVKNTAFSAGDFRSRAGASFAGVDPGGKDTGYHLKAAFGAPEVREQGQWQVAASYRHVGSDAVLDAFTDSDLGLGGTNLEGYTLGLTYGLFRNTSVGVRYLSSKSIDTTINAGVPDAKYNVNSLQVDFNVRF